MSYDGRKISREMENPIDNILIDFSTLVNPILRKNGVTPNILTFFSFITGLIAALCAYYSNFIGGAVFIFISYLFDCMDGNMARMFDMVTSFGDWFDHVSDVTKFSLLYIIILSSSSIHMWNKITFILFTITFLLASLIHLGCQEQNYKLEEWSTLSSLKSACTMPKYIQITKYFGLGTWIYCVIIGLILLHIWKKV